MISASLTLFRGNNAVQVTGLLDTGGMINVIPHHIGLALGGVWERQRTKIQLGGNLNAVEARASTFLAYHPQLTPNTFVELGFAWAISDKAPIIFGQANFFQTFNICFYRAEGFFDIHPVTR